MCVCVYVCVCVCVCVRTCTQRTCFCCVQWVLGLVLQGPLQVVRAPRDAGAAPRSLLGANQVMEVEDRLVFFF